MIWSRGVDPFVGQPIRSLQTFLRKIAVSYPDIPPIIPDGQFGPQTAAAVRGFQKEFGLPVTGEADMDTWNKIILVYDDVSRYTDEPDYVKVYPQAQYVILPGDSSPHLYVIQAMMLSLSRLFANLLPAAVTGIHDEATVASTMELQRVFGMEENGMIEKEFWNNLARIYESFISRDRFQRQGRPPRAEVMERP